MIVSKDDKENCPLGYFCLPPFKKSGYGPGNKLASFLLA